MGDTAAQMCQQSQFKKILASANCRHDIKIELAACASVTNNFAHSLV